jgi:hypothetical protein
VRESRILKRAFGPKRKGVAEKWRKLPTEELHNLYSSPNVFRTYKGKEMSSAEHVERMRGKCIGNISRKDWRTILWHLDLLLTADSVNSGHC